jgi:hypothetical protein
MTHSRAITIGGDGPRAGCDLHVSHIEHDVDQMEGFYTLTLWAPGATEPTHQFDTYRHGYGWTILNAALTADDDDVDTRMKAVADWWTQHHTSTPYEIHRALVAVDDTTWATRDEIAQRLKLPPADLQPGGPAADALDAAARHGLLTWRNLRGEHPYAVLTPAGYDLIHPDDQAVADRSQQHLAAAIADEQAPQMPPSPAAGRAFRAGNSISAQPTPPAATMAAAPATTRVAHANR